MQKSFLGRGLGFGVLVLSGALAATAAGPRQGSKILLNDLLGQKPSLTATLDAVASDQKPTVRIGLTPPTARKGDTVTLSITVGLSADTYTYSTNPDWAGGTRIDIDAKGLDPLGTDFAADHAPNVAKDESTGKPIEEFPGGVTWLRQFVVTAEKPEDVQVTGKLEFKYCNDGGCRAYSDAIRAALGNHPNDDDQKTGSSEAFTEMKAQGAGRPGHTELTFQLAPAHPKPGDPVTLSIGMTLDKGWHTYSTTQKDEVGSTPTTITLAEGKGLRPIGPVFRADRAVEYTAKDVANMEPKEIYHGQVTWTRRFKFEPKGGQTDIGLAGSIHYGVCNESTCLPPPRVSFALGSRDGLAPLPEPLPDDAIAVQATAPAEAGSLWFYLGAAFLGGIVLNVMPCVLPVLAIKVLSFVQQAGASRSRIFLLNLAYTFGVLAVFLTLAALTVGTRLGISSQDISWGGLFQQTRFNLVMACLVFAMGLSLLGVFELPVPGLVGSAAGKNQQEGLLGAFLTGIFATLLATPCTGPFMATAVGWSAQQRTPIVFLVCAVMGLGMASPYLLLGLFPQFVKWLPKPGAWMVRFKEFSGFVLMGSVIFIIYYIDKRFTIPVLVMLLGIALGLWMIGNLYEFNSHIRHKTMVRVAALALTALICWGGYSLAGDSKYKLPWQPFSEARIESLLKENKTVIVDFTADWCLNCHVNEYVALDTKDTLDFVREHSIVALKADFTEQSAEIKRWLMKFMQTGVPLTVIFPGGREREAIVLRATYTQGTLLEKLKQAVGTPPASARSETVSTTIR